MRKDEDIKARLNGLDRTELNILARKLGIKEESKLHSIFEKKQDIIERILNKGDEKKLNEILTIISILKSSDNEWFRNLANDLGLKVSPDKKLEDSGKLEYVKKVIDKSEYTRLVKKIIPDKLTSLTIFGFGITFLLLLLPSTFALFAAIVSIIALVFTLFAYAYPDKTAFGKYVTYTRKEEIIRRIISLILALLFIFTYLSYPSIDSFLCDWGNMATVIGCFLAFLFYIYERSALIIWWKKHNLKVMAGLICIGVAIFIYVEIFTIAGSVYFEDTKKKDDTPEPAVIGATIKIISESWPCRDVSLNPDNSMNEINQKTETTDQKTETIKWFYKNIFKDNKICVTETDKSGKFYLRVFSFSKDNVYIQINYDKKNYLYPKEKDESLNDGWSANKKIRIPIKTTLTGCWKCDRNDSLNGSSYWWWISQSDNTLTITEKDDPTRQIEKYCFYSKKFSKENAHFSYKLKNEEIPDTKLSKIEIIPTDDKKSVEVSFLADKEKINTIKCNLITIDQDVCSSNSSK